LGGQPACFGEYIRHVNVETLDEVGRASPPRRDAVPPTCAYTIYTSGSTGQPKGALNSRAALSNLVDALGELAYRDLSGTLNVALVAPFVFDPSVQQLFASLFFGHTLHIVPDAARLDGRELHRFMNEHRIDVSDGTPSHLKLLSNTPTNDGDAFAPRRLLIGGEPLTVPIIERFQKRFPDAGIRIINLYGVAECAVDSTAYRVDRDEVARLGFVPIGEPIRGVTIYVCDANGRRVDDGDEGEIVIGGIGVGLGYVDRPGENRERFFDDPNSSGARLYRTGDRGRISHGALLECLGRLDRQIKLRGFRIEPGEVETAMLDFQRDHSDRPSAAAVQECTRCLLDSRHPGLSVDDGVCSECRAFEANRSEVERYFHTEADFRRLMEANRPRQPGVADCLLLYSGGKDSSYVLHRLLELGYSVATFTFDNGFISATALNNIARSTDKFGVHHRTVRLGQMNEVFAQSLRSASTVCDGCFRALTLLSTELARSRGIRVVITGLSRGQILETKLRRLFAAGIHEPEEIDRRLTMHRNLFNTRDDAIARSLPKVPSAAVDSDDIQYVDFFRYDPATKREIRAYLEARDAMWRAPKDTGLCSTNCMINDVGIYVHQLEKGYHNYAGPLSWDCRVGLMGRDDALAELRSTIDEPRSKRILKVLGYEPRDAARGVIHDAFVTLRDGPSGQSTLCGYFVSSGHVNLASFRDFLGSRLPDYMIPSFLIRVDAILLNENGKVDGARLPLPDRESSWNVAAPRSDVEARLTGLWREVLGVQAIAPDDNFFDLGGESLAAMTLSARFEQEFGRALSVLDAFRNPTVRSMARLISASPPT
jgi:amino acid adenylation domain-containing protein